MVNYKNIVYDIKPKKLCKDKEIKYPVHFLKDFYDIFNAFIFFI